MKLSATLGALALSLVATSATAEVVEQRPDGFRLESRAVIETGTPEAAWAALVRIGDWWSDSHTYSGDASNISIAAEAGGCWCEVWPGGQSEHGRIILAWPEQGLLRASAPLGDEQAGLALAGLNLLAEAVDVGLERVGGDAGVVAPDLGEQLLAADRLGTGAQQILQDRGFLVRQADALSALVEQGLLGRAELVGADAENRVLGLFDAA